MFDIVNIMQWSKSRLSM